MNGRQYLLSSEENGRPPLVLGHSLGTTFPLWDASRERLEENFRVLRYNPHPYQTGNGSASIEAMGRGLLQLLDRFRWRSVDFCGVSMSGLLGQWLALEAPDRVRRLVLSNTAARIGNPDHWQERINLVRQKGLPDVASALVNRWFSSRFASEQPEVVDRFIQDLRSFPTDQYLAACEAIREADFRDRVGLLKTRTLIIAGSHDLATTVADAEFLHEEIKSSRLLVFPCGHLACIESSEAFTQAVTEFLLEAP